MDDITNIWTMVLNKTTVDLYSIHGPEHWARVERNGLYLAEKVGADRIVVQLFAVFHDCMRENDSRDPQHGLRGAEFAKSIRGKLRFLTDAQFETLYYACEWHTDQTFIDDVTIAACWDADRLDLRRVAIWPNAKFLNTPIAKEIANKNLYTVLSKQALRTY